MPDLEINIKSSVGQAVAGMNAVQKELAQTAVATAKLDSAMKRSIGGTNEAAYALSNLGRIAQDAPFGFIGITNNLNPMLESFQRLKSTTGSTGSALKALGASLIGPAGLGFAVSVVSSALLVFGDKLFGAKKGAEEAKDAFQGMLDSAAKEALKLRESFALITDANVPLENRKSIIKELRSEYGVYLKNISDEALLTGQAASAYELINTAILRKLQLQAAEEKILPFIKEQVDLQYQLNQLQKEGANLRRFIDATSGADQFKVQADNAIAIRDSNKNLADQLSLQRRIAAVGKEINNLFGQLAPLLPSSERATKGIPLTINKSKTKSEFETRLKELSAELAPIPIKIKPIAGSVDGSLTKQDADFLSGNTSVLDGLNNKIQQDAIEKARKKLEEMKKELLSIGDTLNNFVSPAFDAAFNAISNGENPIKAVGEAVQRLVIDMAKAAIQSALVALLINSISPVSAGFSFGGLFTRFLGGGIPGMAQGGIVPSGYPNDSYPAMLSSNEAVIPLDRLSSMMNTGGGGFPSYLPVFELRGDVLRAWYQRAEGSYRRRN